MISASNNLQYTLQVSPHARHVRLKVTAADGLCVVVPRGFDESDVVRLLAEKRGWIERALLKVGGAPEPLAADYRPGELVLPAFDERWAVDYQVGGKRVRLREDRTDSRLTLFNAQDDQAATFALLRRWLGGRARELIVPMAHDLASELGLSINRVTIRNQRGRWGSCSSKKNLSLNLKLLFVSPAQMRYVLVHELCHTVHMNHSAAFWRLVEQHEPESGMLKRTMRSAWRAVPTWV